MSPKINDVIEILINSNQPVDNNPKMEIISMDFSFSIAIMLWIGSQSQFATLIAGYGNINV